MANKKSLADFEKNMQQLEDILESMGNEDVTIEQSVSLYAQAAKLIQTCTVQLDVAQVRIDEISSKLEEVEDPQ